MRKREAAVAVLVALAVAFCSGCTNGSDRRADDPPRLPDEPTGLARCGNASPTTQLEDLTLEPAPDVSLPAVQGRFDTTAVVLLHQTDVDGFCGWVPFAEHLRSGTASVLAFDMCGWGDAECPVAWNRRTTEQVQAAVDHVREQLGAERVVLVGASMGAARTVFAMADGVDGVDAWVALSPPVSWDGREVVGEARGIEVPGLVVHDPDDGDEEYAAARRVAARSGAEFVSGRGGHGYDLLLTLRGTSTRFGDLVADFVAGQPSV